MTGGAYTKLPITCEIREYVSPPGRRRRPGYGERLGGRGVAIGTSIDPLDLLDLGAELTVEERLLAESVRAWVADRALPRLADLYERGEFPAEWPRELGALGLLGMQLEGYGLPGAGAVAHGLACLELEAGDSGLRSFLSVQGSLAMFAIRRYGSEEQRERWLGPMAAGEAIGCFALTEPDAGSDPSAMRTRATRERGGWRIDGAKAWISNGSTAHVAVVWATTDDGIRGFLVPTGAPGVTARDIRRKLSFRASVTSELALDGVQVPGDAILPLAEGLRAPLACLTEARYGIVWGAVGAARACLESALAYSAGRVQFGRPIAGFQLTQAKLADMAASVTTAGLLAFRLAALKDSGRLRPEQVSLGKLHNVRAALSVARTARAILGANGVTLEYPAMRHAANLESVLTYEGTHEIHSLVVGRALTGIDAFG
jgi:glutaryl-CoA dehydrogenase